MAKRTTTSRIASGTSDLHSHFNQVLLELKQALQKNGAATPINDDDNAVDTLGNADAVATVVNDTFFPSSQGVDPADITDDTVRQLSLRIVKIQAGQLK
jgi:hypothetical protein